MNDLFNDVMELRRELVGTCVVTRLMGVTPRTIKEVVAYIYEVYGVAISDDLAIAIIKAEQLPAVALIRAFAENYENDKK